MNTAIVKASELDDRWDGEYHVTLAGLRVQVARLRETVSVEDAVARLLALPTENKARLRVLCRGASVGSEALDRAVHRHPHLALALVLNAAPRMTARAEDALERLRAVADLAPPTPSPDPDAPDWAGPGR